MLDPVALFALLLAAWALYRTRTRPTTTINWTAPSVTTTARLASDIGAVRAGTLLNWRPDGTVAPARRP